MQVPREVVQGWPVVVGAVRAEARVRGDSLQGESSIPLPPPPLETNFPRTNPKGFQLRECGTKGRSNFPGWNLRGDI